MTKLFNKSEYKARRKLLRNNPTKTEKLMWEILKGKKLKGYKFRRQYGVGKYVIDYYCAGKKFALEIDGEVHNNEKTILYDKNRDSFIKNAGIKILRIKSEEVERNIEGVVEMILNEIEK